MVDRGADILSNQKSSISELGDLLHEAWVLKRSLSNRISNGRIDEIYEAGRAAGAYGGKLLGAGGGGFMLFLVAPDKREQVRESLKELIHVSVGFDNEGSRIVLYQPDGL
jgi:D-glycero-alpha-D-manno-heptose-7-phosphate kinase